MEAVEKENKKSLKISKSLLVKLIILGTLVLFYIMFILLANCRDFCESYSKTVVQFYTLVFGHISSFFPFSIFELFVIGSILYLGAWIFFFIRKTIKTGIKNTYHMFMRLLIILFSILNVYQGTAGIEYSRKEIEIPIRTKLEDNPEVYNEVAYYFLEDFNKCASELQFNEKGSVVMPYSRDRLITNLELEYKKFNNDYLYDYTSKAKPMYQTGWFYTMMSITGVSFAPTAEPNYNVTIPDAYLPFTIAHEMAHAKGVMPEESANLVAAYICLNSEDPFIRYSGYDTAFWSLPTFIMAQNKEGALNEFYSKIDNNIYRNNSYEYDFWDERAVFEKIADWVNDLYLKFNRDNGTISYSDNIDTKEEDNKFIINSLSRYQALFMWIYFDKPNAK